MGAIRFFGGDYLWYQADKAHRAGDYLRALAYYDALIERFPKHRRRAEALFWSAELLPNFENFAATIFPTGSSVIRKGLVAEELPKGALGRVERYELLLAEHPNHRLASHVHFKLADAYHTLGDPRAEELYLQTLKNALASRRWDAGLRLTQLYISQARFEEAADVLEYCRVELGDPLDLESLIRLGDFLAALGDKPGAREVYGKALQQVEGIRETFVGDGGREPYSVAGEYRQRIRTRLANLDVAWVNVQGRVTLLGRPMAGVHVYAKAAEDPSLPNLSSVGPGYWVTDDDGNFQGKLPPGQYDFGISLNHYQAQLVEGTHLQIKGGRQRLTANRGSQRVEFRFVERVQLNTPTSEDIYTGGPLVVEWAPYPGAWEYKVTVAGVALDEGGGPRYVEYPVALTQEQSYVVDVANIVPFGLLGIDAQGVDPTSLVGRPESFDRLRINVSALDWAGQTLSSSSGLFFGGGGELAPGEIPVQAGLRSEAEELLFRRKYDEAVALLEQQIKENSEDLTALWILARIYYSGTHGQGQDTWDQRSFAHRDLEKSLNILRRIQALQPGPEVEAALAVVQRALQR